MPLILPLEAFDFWLDCANVDAVTAAALLTAPREDFLEAHEISTAVDRVGNDRPTLLARIAQSNTGQVHTHQRSRKLR
jgi:putative SOS response-associated peptidase YedK